MNAARPTDQTILVTGGAGFIGSHLSKALLVDNDVRILDSFTSGNKKDLPDGATIIEGDIRNNKTLARATEDADLVYHEAALVSVARSVENPMLSHKVNATATLDLLEKARQEGARVVLASSAAIYGHPESVPISESDSKDPTSPYGVDKLTIDHYARLFTELYDLETIPLRYFNVYGPGQVAGDYSGVISVFIDQALSDKDITVHGDGMQTRDFVYIDDVVQANCLAGVTGSVGKAYNIGTGESVSIQKLAEIVQEVTQTDSEIVHIESRGGDIVDSEANITAAENELGYEPSVPFREGIRRTVEWYRERQ